MNDDIISDLLEDFINESLSYKDVFNIINDSTKNFSKESGKVRFNTRYENNLANDILIQAYSDVENKGEPDLDENNDLVYEITYSNPIRESLSENKNKISKYVVTKDGVTMETFDTEAEANRYMWITRFSKESEIPYRWEVKHIEESFDEEDESDENLYCPNCDNKLTWMGYQGNFGEFKCPECNKYWYHNGEDLFDENDLNWDESRGLYIKESKNKRKRKIKPDDGKLHFYKDPIKGKDMLNHALSSGDVPTMSTGSPTTTGGGMGEGLEIDTPRPKYKDESLDPDWVNNTINTVSNTDKDPAVIATKKYHKRHPKKLRKGEMIVSSLSEKIENHNELNQDLFNDEELKPEVKDKLLEIVEKFKDYLKQDEIDLDIKDVQIVGSNAGYNYTDDSDIDLHIIADLSIYQNQEELAEKLYLAYKSLFNDKYDPTIYGHSVEVYVEPYQEIEHE